MKPLRAVRSSVAPIRRTPSAVLFAALLAAGLTSSVALGQTVKTWTANTGGNLTDATAWNGGTAPVSGNALVFNNAGGGTIVFNAATFGGSLSNASSLAGISFTGTPGAYLLDLSTNGFNISNPNAITMASTVANDQTIGTAAGSGTIFVGTAAQGTTAFFVNASTTNSLVINSNIANGSSTNNSIVFGNSSGVAPAGTGNIVVNGVISGMANGLTKTGLGTLTLAGANTNSGVTSINAGTVILSGSSTSSAITVAGGTLNLTGTITGGSVTVNAAQSALQGSGGTGSAPTGGVFNQATTGLISGTTTVAVNSSLFAGGNPGSATLAGNNTTTGAFTVGTGVYFNTVNPYNTVPFAAPTLTLTGANNGQSNITANATAKVVLDFSAPTAPTTNILNSTTQATAVNLTGGQLELIGKSGATNSQRLTVGNGIVPTSNTASQIKLTQNGASSLSLDVGSINRGSSATIDIVFPTTGTVASTNSAVRGLATASNLAWGTANNGTTLLGANGTALSAYSAWSTGVSNYLTTNNVDVTNGDSVSGVTPNTLRFNGTSVSLTNSGTSNLSGGTILVTPGTTANITGGSLRSTNTGTGAELLVINNGNLTVGSTLTTNSASDRVTVISSFGQKGNATFTGNNSIGTGGLFVNNTTATFSGNNTINGPVTVGYNGVLTLSGNNTTTGNFTWAAQGGGTLVLAGAGALGTGVLNTSGSGMSNTVKFASDSQVSGGGAPTASINWSGGNGAFTQHYIMDRATAGTSAVNLAFSSAFLNQQGTWNVLQGSNYTTGYTLPTLTISGATSYGANNTNTTSVINTSGANIALAGGVAPIVGLTSTRVTTLSLNGTSTGNVISGAIADNTLNTAALIKNGTGTWTLQGANTFTGATTVNGGTLVLDYGANNSSKLSSTGVLTLSGGTLQLKGGSTAQTVASTTFNTGQSAITQNGGTSTIALGAITSTSGAADFTSGVASTTTVNGSNGLLGGVARYTVGGADWAVSGASGTNPITALSTYTPLNFASGGTNTVNYSLAGSNGTAVTGILTLGTLKLSPTGAGQSLALGANQLTLGSATAGTAGLLFTGAHDYTITGTNKIAAQANPLILQHWGTGVLSLNIPVNSNIEKYGTGKIVLGANASASNSTGIFAGSLQISSETQLSNATTNTLTINGSFGNGSAFIVNTAGGAVAVTRPIALGAQGGNYIDVVGGNTLTLSGIISGTQSASANNIVTFGGASAVDATNNAPTSGTIVLNAANSYTGGTTFAGGTVNLATAEVAGSSGPLGAAGTLTFAGGTLQYSATNQFDYSSRFSPVANQQFRIDTNGQNVSYAYGLAGASSSLTKSGSGTLTLAGNNTYTGTTTISAGTLQIGNGTDSGSIASSSNIVNNGALVYNVGSGNRTYANVISGSGTLTQAGTGTFTLSGANTFSGEVTVSSGTLATSSTGTFGAGNITVGSGASLTLGNNASISDSASLTFAGNTIGGIFLNFIGAETVTGVTNSISSSFLSAGTYNVSELNTFFGTSIFNGTGSLTVSAIPEPSTFASLAGLGILGYAVTRRRRRN